MFKSHFLVRCASIFLIGLRYVIQLTFLSFQVLKPCRPHCRCVYMKCVNFEKPKKHFADKYWKCFHIVSRNRTVIQSTKYHIWIKWLTVRNYFLLVLSEKFNKIDCLFLPNYLEVLRKHPSTPVVFRTATTDYTLPNTNMTVPAGTQLMIPIYAIHHDDTIYTKPEVFMPDRFNKENMKDRHACSFIPFSCGPRACIGSKFAMMHMKITLVNLLRKYRFSIGSKTPFPLKFKKNSYILCADDIWLTVEHLKWAVYFKWGAVYNLRNVRRRGAGIRPSVTVLTKLSQTWPFLR